jgi:hypothetical protein
LAKIKQRFKVDDMLKYEYKDDIYWGVVCDILPSGPNDAPYYNIHFYSVSDLNGRNVESVDFSAKLYQSINMKKY